VTTSSTTHQPRRCSTIPQWNIPLVCLSESHRSNRQKPVLTTERGLRHSIRIDLDDGPLLVHVIPMNEIIAERVLQFVESAPPGRSSIVKIIVGVPSREGGPWDGGLGTIVLSATSANYLQS
jgi:hypothetical protein